MSDDEQPCTWTPSCDQQGIYDTEFESRPGLVIRVTVCAAHLERARVYGYRVVETIERLGRTAS